MSIESVKISYISFYKNKLKNRPIISDIFLYHRKLSTLLFNRKKTNFYIHPVLGLKGKYPCGVSFKLNRTIFFNKYMVLLYSRNMFKEAYIFRNLKKNIF